MNVLWLVPLAAFIALALAEQTLDRGPTRATRPADHALNIAGLIIQGSLVPLASYWLATRVLAVHFPESAGSLAIGWWGAFVLNVVGVDFLYYWQHRLFHRVSMLWALHRCHHAAGEVTVWTTARNSFAINFLFVYLPVNAVLAYWCDVPQGFFAGAALTAALDLWRHSRLPAPRALATLLVTPMDHHEHHAIGGQGVNFGANLALWDRLFGTYRATAEFPERYGSQGASSPWRQFLFPW